MPTCPKLEDVEIGAVGSSFAPSDSEIIYSTGESLEGERMRFRLIYSGPLLGAHAGKTRSEHKHEIRKSLSPQLKRLWETKKSLRAWFQRSGFVSRAGRSGAVVGAMPTDLPGEEWELNRLAGLEATANKWRIQDGRFIPLVTADIVARCRIDVLFLRPEDKGYVLQGGDLDNRLKTLFDALRMPKPNEECGIDKEPCFVLLEDDSLISEISIVTDNLLMLPNQSVARTNDAFLVIDVQIESTEAKFDELQWFVR